jgi:hypothetical protein
VQAIDSILLTPPVVPDLKDHSVKGFLVRAASRVEGLTRAPAAGDPGDLLPRGPRAAAEDMVQKSTALVMDNTMSEEDGRPGCTVRQIHATAMQSCGSFSA